MLHVGFIPIARTTFDIELAQSMTEQARRLLESHDMQVIGPDHLVTGPDDIEPAHRIISKKPLDLLIIFQATFADSTMAVNFATSTTAPVLLWAVPEEQTGGRLRLNSLCGINLAAHALRRRGYHYEHLYANPQDEQAIRTIRTIAQAGRVRHLLTQTRVGRIGENPAGFDTCLIDPVALQERFGLEVVQVELNSIFHDLPKANNEVVDAVRQDIQRRVAGVSEQDQSAVDGTLRTYVTLRQLATQENLHGLAVRCWPEFFTEAGCAACGAMSMLSDEMTPCSCEVDVNGTITQLILQWLSGGPAFGTDIVAIDAELDGLVLWHCGLAPLSMADPAFTPQATIHSNRRLPLLMEFPLRPGTVTLARLSQADGSYRLVIGRAEVISAPMHFTGTSGVVHFPRPAAEVMDTILSEGLEHHVCLTYGDHTETLMALARILDLPVLRI